MLNDIVSKALEAAGYIASKVETNPKIAIVLDYGLDSFVDEITEDRIEIPYEEIPNFPKAKHSSFGNRIILGKVYGKNVIVMQDKFHYYEGYELDELTFPIRIFALLGVETIIMSTFAGWVSKNLKSNDLMLITDHINLSGHSPIRGYTESEFGNCFPNMMHVYSKRLIELSKAVASLKAFDEEFNRRAMRKIKEGYDLTIGLNEGVYAFMSGPQYETAAEVKMLEVLGADAVGMTLVPEATVATHMGIEVLGIACILNQAGMGDPFGQSDDMEIIDEKFKNLVMRIIMKM